MSEKINQLKPSLRQLDTGERVVEGYAALYSTRSKLLTEHGKTFYEEIEPGAFDAVLADPDLDVTANLQHDRSKLLARTKSGTLHLEADERGLKYSFTLPNTQLGNDVAELLERGDLQDASFRFAVAPGNVRWGRVPGMGMLRTLNVIDKLMDISVVDTPAYEGANAAISARDYDEIEASLPAEEITPEPEVNTEERAIEDVANTDNKGDEVNADEPEITANEPEDRVLAPVTDGDAIAKLQADVEKLKDIAATEAIESKAKETRDAIRDEIAAEQGVRSTDNVNEEEARAADEEPESEQRNIVINNKEENKMDERNLFDSIRSAAQSEGGTLIASERAPIDGDTGAFGNVIPLNIAELDILGKEPIWKNMGAKVMEGAKGTFELPYENPIVAELLAELASANGDTTTPSGILIQPHRYTVQKTLTIENLASATDSYLQSLLADMAAAADRKITNDIYTKLLGYAGAVAGADISKAGFDALQGGAEVENNGAFFAARKTFFEAKGVAIDSGSGRFLVEQVNGTSVGNGSTYDGVPFWFSSLFEDGADQKYVVYGDPSRIHIADYGMFEIIIDKYTKAAEGQVVFTINKIANVAVRNHNRQVY